MHQNLRMEKSINDVDVALLMEFLKGCLKLNGYKRKIVYKECLYLITCYEKTSVPLKKIVEERIFELEEATFEPFTERIMKQPKVRIEFNKHLLNLLNDS